MSKMKSQWDVSSIAGMERTALQEADGACSVEINGRWLEVRAAFTPGENFSYFYAGCNVTRQFAVQLLEKKS